nr:MAG TPA: hypothetical protein [Inoviridae sp.]
MKNLCFSSSLKVLNTLDLLTLLSIKKITSYIEKNVAVATFFFKVNVALQLAFRHFLHRFSWGVLQTRPTIYSTSFSLCSSNKST